MKERYSQCGSYMEGASWELGVWETDGHHCNCDKGQQGEDPGLPEERAMKLPQEDS
jgi:hypothetical protein